MATDRDDEIARRYRALATEVPPAALDAAILARSRRAVGSRPGGLRRWGPPLSIAAVLVLASGVVIRMQAEKPGIETSAPVREEAAAPAPMRDAAAPPAPEASEMKRAPETTRAPEMKSAPETTRAPEIRRAPRKAQGSQPPANVPGRFVAEPPVAARHADVQAIETLPPAAVALPPAALAAAPAASVAAPAPEAPAPSSARQRAVPMQLNAAPPSAGAAAAGDASDAAAIAPRARAAGQLKSDALEKRAAPANPEAALDRIVQLRAEGRDDEADKALEAFRRDYPSYRMSDARWERVRRRAP